MRLTVVGCSGGHPSPDAACSAYLLEHQGFRLLLDLGSGALGPLQNHIDPRDVDAVFLTHLHGDHWLDLVPLSHARTHHPDGRVPPPLRVIAPGADRSRILGAIGRSEESLASVFAFEAPGDTVIGPLTATVVRTRHPVEAYAVKLTAGAKTLVYTGDTGPFAELATFARGADLLLAEAGFVDGVANPVGVHLTATQTGELARDADVGRLVVTHVAPWHDAGAQARAAGEAFGGPTDLARPGATFEV